MEDLTLWIIRDVFSRVCSSDVGRRRGGSGTHSNGDNHVYWPYYWCPLQPSSGDWSLCMVKEVGQELRILPDAPRCAVCWCFTWCWMQLARYDAYLPRRRIVRHTYWMDGASLPKRCQRRRQGLRTMWLKIEATLARCILPVLRLIHLCIWDLDHKGKVFITD